MAHRYLSESTQLELSNEYQHDKVKVVFRDLCVILLWMKVTLALKGLKHGLYEAHNPKT